METYEAVAALGALAQDSRLAVFRLLVERGPEGYPAGGIAGRLGIAAPTLSFHLKALAQAGLVCARKEGRFLHYSANFERMSALVSFLTENCCTLGATCAPSCAPARPTMRPVARPASRPAARSAARRRAKKPLPAAASRANHHG